MLESDLCYLIKLTAKLRIAEKYINDPENEDIRLDMLKLANKVEKRYSAELENKREEEGRE